jgi:hypothetical protein
MSLYSEGIQCSANAYLYIYMSVLASADLFSVTCVILIQLSSSQLFFKIRFNIILCVRLELSVILFHMLILDIL